MALAASRPVDYGVGRFGPPHNSRHNQSFHKPHRRSLDWMLCVWVVHWRGWGFADFLRQAPALPAAAVLQFWQPASAGRKTSILSCWVRVRCFCGGIAAGPGFAQTELAGRRFV